MHAGSYQRSPHFSYYKYSELQGRLLCGHILKGKSIVGRLTFSLLKISVYGAVRGFRSNRKMRQWVEDCMLLKSRSALLMIQPLFDLYI